jgi:hypothetical protein
VNHPRSAWAAGWILQVPAYDTRTGPRGRFHEVVVGTKQLLACPMAHYVPACMRINELPVHIASGKAARAQNTEARTTGPKRPPKPPPPGPLFLRLALESIFSRFVSKSTSSFVSPP